MVKVYLQIIRFYTTWIVQIHMKLPAIGMGVFMVYLQIVQSDRTNSHKIAK